MDKMRPQETHLANWLGDTEEDAMDEKLTAALDNLYAAEPEEESVGQALNRLKANLDEILPEKIHYDLLPGTTVGDIWVAVKGEALVAVEYDLSEADFVEFLQRRLSGRAERSAEETEKAKEQVRAYLQGENTTFELPVDLSALTEFQRQVLEATAHVPRGQVATYAEIAHQIGRPRAFRAVGQALRRNPVPIVIPCHRVIASDGTLGGYAGRMGDQRKVKLLKLEGVMLA